MSANRGKVLLAFLVLTSGLGCHRKVQHSVTLNWQPSKPSAGVRVVGYNVYRRVKEEGGFARLATQVPGPPYEDHLVTSGRTYVYAVTAVDQSGRESRLSEQVQATIP